MLSRDSLPTDKPYPMLRIDGATTMEFAIPVDGHYEGPLQGSCIAAANNSTLVRFHVILNGCSLRAFGRHAISWLAGQATLPGRALDIGNVIEQRVLVVASMAALGKMNARMQRRLNEWTRQLQLLEAKTWAFFGSRRFAGFGCPSVAIITNRIPIAAMITIQEAFRCGGCMGLRANGECRRHMETPLSSYHRIRHISNHQAALLLITFVEAVEEAVATLVAIVAHGQSGAIVSRIFLSILVAGMRQWLAAKAAQLILAHGTVRIAIAYAILIQAISTGAGRLIAAVRTVDDVVTPARGGDALLLAKAGHLLSLGALETLLRLLRHAQIGGIDDLAALCHTRLVGMPHLKVGIGEARLAVGRQVARLCRLSLLVLHVGAVDLLLPAGLLLRRRVLREDIGQLTLCSARCAGGASKEVARRPKLLRHKEDATCIRCATKLSALHAHKRGRGRPHGHAEIGRRHIEADRHTGHAKVRIEHELC